LVRCRGYLAKREVCSRFREDLGALV